MTDRRHTKFKITVKDLLGHKELEKMDEEIRQTAVESKKTAKQLLKMLRYCSDIQKAALRIAAALLQKDEVTVRDRLEVMQICHKITREHNKTVECHIALAKVTNIEPPKEKPKNKLVDFGDEPETPVQADPLKPAPAEVSLE